MHSAENPRKVPNSMQGLTVSETYDLITAVHDGWSRDGRTTETGAELGQNADTL